MDVNKYIKSDQYAAVVETDRAVMINGAWIPLVLQNGVKCNDTKEGLHEVTISFMTDRFIRISGEPSKDFLKEHGYVSEYSFDGCEKKPDEDKKCEYKFTDGQETVVGDSVIQKVLYGAADIIASLGEKGYSLDEIIEVAETVKAVSKAGIRSLQANDCPY